MGEGWIDGLINELLHDRWDGCMDRWEDGDQIITQIDGRLVDG